MAAMAAPMTGTHLLHGQLANFNDKFDEHAFAMNMLFRFPEWCGVL